MARSTDYLWEFSAGAEYVQKKARFYYMTDIQKYSDELYQDGYDEIDIRVEEDDRSPSGCNLWLTGRADKQKIIDRIKEQEPELKAIYDTAWGHLANMSKFSAGLIEFENPFENNTPSSEVDNE
jgi:hypothetical protein